ncbi:hypothetical protein [Psychrobacter vallis]|uniref:hypothetical protein n=1 Tax=Psychrobacter vallis TaxID=248451 RepID=UPI00191933F3|nr:hypothetical protein [Psychrobacter vallis]
MSHPTTTIADRSCLANALTCYLQSDAVVITLTNMQVIEDKYGAHYNARRYDYQLSLGELSLFALTLHLPTNSKPADIESVRMAALKSALVWQKTSLSKNKESEAIGYNVLVVDIQFTERPNSSNQFHDHDQHNNPPNRLKHDFGVRYFEEDLIVDMNDSTGQLQVFSWHDWHLLLAMLQTPCALWRFLAHRLEQLHDSAIKQRPSLVSEEALATQFLYSTSLLAPAIVIDNALIKYKIQDQPNPALVAMTLAYRHQSTTAHMYHQHMQQSSTLWSQLCSQMIEVFEEKRTGSHDKVQEVELAYWQQQLLDESLFSRHELIRTLYRHPKQGHKLQQEGYVVHQHSYESLGRHYVLIFYGQDGKGKHGKQVIKPNLEKIAQDVATRLPIAELHHVIVLGIDFITETDDTFIDIDLWIQPIDAMTQRERQLTKQLQRLKQQAAQQLDK